MVRAYTDAQYSKRGEGLSVIEILSDSIIYSLTRFIDFGEARRGDREREMTKVIADFKGDATLFEIGCFFYVMIDLWHFNNTEQDVRAETVDYLLDRFVRIFEEALPQAGINNLFNSRLDVYAEALRQEREVADVITGPLTELVMRTEHNTPPAPYDPENEPIMIRDCFQQYLVQVALASFLGGLMPVITKNLERSRTGAAIVSLTQIWMRILSSKLHEAFRLIICLQIPPCEDLFLELDSSQLRVTRVLQELDDVDEIMPTYLADLSMNV